MHDFSDMHGCQASSCQGGCGRRRCRHRPPTAGAAATTTCRAAPPWSASSGWRASTPPTVQTRAHVASTAVHEVGWCMSWGQARLGCGMPSAGLLLRTAIAETGHQCISLAILRRPAAQPRPKCNSAAAARLLRAAGQPHPGGPDAAAGPGRLGAPVGRPGAHLDIPDCMLACLVSQWCSASGPPWCTL